MKKVSILGSTGSIGRSTLEVIRKYPNRFEVVALSTGRNIELLLEQIREFRPKIVAVSDHERAETLRTHISDVEVLSGVDGLLSVASFQEADFVVSAISGSAGLLPTLQAIRAGKTIGLANKETLVMAGEIVKRELQLYNSKLIPVDSEHSAIFQCLEGRDLSTVRRLILTASGGPFRELSAEQMNNIGVADALNHPTWNMGKKITIDSATLMNKGLEVIEAHFLFDVSPDAIEVIIHPQSIVHSLVEFIDGSILAQLSIPDMKGPIAYALSYPERLESILQECSLTEIGTLIFEEPDIHRFPCLGYAYEALRLGGTAPTVLNAANEMAVDAFLRGIIPFVKIPVIIEKILHAHTPQSINTLEDVLEADRWARRKFNEIVEED
jgi:1-deoxy-D-xylulose-5-phosphate reductoisomerase